MPVKITKDNPFKIVFVCLGNICRSPTAEGVMQHLVNQRSLQPYFYIDSAGTSAYHIGEPANSKSQKTANGHGITLKSRARRFETYDLEEFDMILAMDKENYENLQRMDENGLHSDKIKMFREYDPKPEGNEVPDPYFGGIDGFQHVFEIVLRTCENLLDELQGHIVTENLGESN